MSSKALTLKTVILSLNRIKIHQTAKATRNYSFKIRVHPKQQMAMKFQKLLQSIQRTKMMKI